MSEAIDIRLAGKVGSFELDAEFQAPADGITVLFGSSGAGKTTVLRAIAGLERLSGRVRVDGTEWQSVEGDRFVETERRRIGYVFQDAALFPHLTVAENLDYAVRRRRATSSLTLTTAAEWFGLSSLLDRAPATLSGGERQRVAIARALLSAPSLLLMDEPLASLDVAARASVLGHLERVRGDLGAPTLYVTHAVDEAVRLADHMVWLEGGKVEAVGSAGGVLSQLDRGLRLGQEASGVIEATVLAHDEEYHLSELHSSWGKLTVPRVSREVGETVRLRVRASDVSLSLERERKSTILNVLEGVVQRLVEDSPGQMLLSLHCPEDEGSVLLARVTRRSAEQLQLTEGVEVYLRVKGVSVR